MPQTDETALEKTFSDLAYNHLRDRSQALLDYLVGFQMLKQEDDGQRAVGIFGFEIDSDYYYAPAFFLNGEIRGLDSLYSVKSDLFVPLTENWVNSIIDRRQSKLGDPDRRNRTERGVAVPNYSRMKVVPGGGGGTNLKIASELVDKMTGDREDQIQSDLPSVLNDAGVAGLFKQALDANPRLLDRFESFGYSVLDLYDVEAPVRKTASAEAVVIINSITDDGATELSDDEKTRVVEGGTVVLDNRPEVSKAQVYTSETKRALENPTGGGLYDVLWSDGTISLAVIGDDDNGINTVMVYNPDTDKYGCLPARDIVVTRKYSRQELIEWLEDKATKADAIRDGDMAFFISENGTATPIMVIRNVRTGIDGITAASICSGDHGTCAGTWFTTNNGNPKSNAFATSHRPSVPSERVNELLITETGGESPRYTENQCILNGTKFYAVVVNRFREERNDPTDNYVSMVYDKPEGTAQLTASDFGDYNTVHQTLDKIAADLTVWKTGSEVTVKTASDVHSFRSEADGLRCLMGHLGLGEDDARAIIKQAAPFTQNYKYLATTKVAAQLLDMPNDDFADFGGGGFMTGFHNEQTPFNTTIQAQSPQNREFYQYQSPFGAGGTDAEGDVFAITDTAAQTGQKEVFDAASLASLIKSHTPTDLVDRFLPTITAGMDRIGRMLFLIYWHYEDFEDRWGETDISEMIDNLRAVFEQIGDVIIFAKKRTLAGDPSHFGMDSLPAMEG